MVQPNEAMPENTADSVQFVIQRVYIKDTSFEAPHTPQIFQQTWEPDLSLDVNTQHKKLDENVYEVVLTITSTVKIKETHAFVCEVKQAGIFTVQGASDTQLDHILNSYCPNILFPYARETISSQVVRGSFPQLVLAPINFDALYMQKLEEDKAKSGQKPAAVETTIQ